MSKRSKSTLAQLDERIARLETCSPAELRVQWAAVFGESPSPNLRPDLMRRAIAHHLQEQHFGGLSKPAARRLATLRSSTNGTSLAARSPLRPGTRLVREWQGETHHVLVTATGVEYRDRKYRSLSGVARTITGVAWSGPRFFGLLVKPPR